MKIVEIETEEFRISRSPCWWCPPGLMVDTPCVHCDGDGCKECGGSGTGPEHYFAQHEEGEVMYHLRIVRDRSRFATLIVACEKHLVALAAAFAEEVMPIIQA